MPSPPNLTSLLQDWAAGDEDALERLTPAIYEDLRKIAYNRLRGERSGHTLQPTALVNEAYLRLVDQDGVAWQSRAHFFAIAARIMRRVLVDHARRRRADKRGGQEAVAVTIGAAVDAEASQDVDVLRLDDALKDLARRDERQSRVVELRYFAGMTIEETAEALGVSPATVKLDWQMARAWLYNALEPK